MVDEATKAARKPFKQRRSFTARLAESSDTREKFPTKIPVIVERYVKEKTLPLMDKTKFLISKGISMSQFAAIIRDRMSLTSTQSLFIFINKASMISMSTTFGEVYDELKDDDGFIYVTYASQESFG